MPDGKAAGQRCIHLDDMKRCGIFFDPQRPATCAAFKADPVVCGDNAAMAIELLTLLEIQTA
jgi:hypothetical protein